MWARSLSISTASLSVPLRNADAVTDVKPRALREQGTVGLSGKPKYPNVLAPVAMLAPALLTAVTRLGSTLLPPSWSSV